MKKKFISWAILQIEAKRKLSDLERKKIKYGLEGFYNLITKLIVVVGVSLYFHLFWELILLIVIYSLVRLYGFGLHAKKSWQCWISSVPIYIGGCFFIHYVVLPKYVVIGIWIFAFLSFLFFAPADTAARPLIHEEKRKRAKVLSLLIVTSLFILQYFVNSNTFLNATLYALTIQSVVMNPLTYKIFGASYSNYKAYVNT